MSRNQYSLKFSWKILPIAIILGFIVNAIFSLATNSTPGNGIVGSAIWAYLTIDSYRVLKARAFIPLAVCFPTNIFLFYLAGSNPILLLVLLLLVNIVGLCSFFFIQAKRPTKGNSPQKTPEQAIPKTHKSNPEEQGLSTWVVYLIIGTLVTLTAIYATTSSNTNNPPSIPPTRAPTAPIRDEIPSNLISQVSFKVNTVKSSSKTPLARIETRNDIPGWAISRMIVIMTNAKGEMFKYELTDGIPPSGSYVRYLNLPKGSHGKWEYEVTGIHGYRR